MNYIGVVLEPYLIRNSRICAKSFKLSDLFVSMDTYIDYMNAVFLGDFSVSGGGRILFAVLTAVRCEDNDYIGVGVRSPLKITDISFLTSAVSEALAS